MQENNYYYTFINISKDNKILLGISNIDIQTEIDNTIYTSNQTMQLDSIELSSNLNANSTTLTFIPTRTQKDLLFQSGNFKVEIFQVKIADKKYKKVFLKYGRVGDITIEGEKMVIEIIICHIIFNT